MIKIIDWLALLKVAKNLKHEKVKRMGMEIILECFYDTEQKRAGARKGGLNFASKEYYSI